MEQFQFDQDLAIDFSAEGLDTIHCISAKRQLALRLTWPFAKAPYQVLGQKRNSAASQMDCH